MSDSSPLLRQWQLLQLLAHSQQGLGVVELAEWMQMSDRSVRRDLRLLQTAGFPIEEIVGYRGQKKWRMPPLGNLPPFQLTELLSLYVAGQFLEPLAGTPFWTGLQTILNRVRLALGDAAINYLAELARTLHVVRFGSGNYSQRHDLISDLMQAISRQLRVELLYCSALDTEPAPRVVDPTTFLWHFGSLYLLAWTPRHEQMRTYKVDRIVSTRPLGPAAAKAAAFDPAEWLKDSFGIIRNPAARVSTVRIWFAADRARYVSEGWWHHSQQLQPQADGSLIAEFRLADWSELLSWVLSFGRSAKILAPDALQNDFRELLLDLLKELPSATDVHGRQKP